MANDVVQWFREKSGELATASNSKKDTLIEVQSCILHLDNQARLELSLASDLNTYFDCLAGEEEEAEVAGRIVCLLIEALPAAEALTRHGLSIESALGHSSAQVKSQFLKLMLKYATVECLVFFTAQLPNILTQIIECLTCPERNIAEGSVQFFKLIGQSLQGVQIIFSDGFITILKRIMLFNDITRFRIYEIVVDVSVRHTEALQASHQSGILPSLVAELKSSDTLIQLNALELLTNLTANSAGLLYLQREGVIKFLVDQIINIKNDPLSFILLPGLIEFFGNLYKLQPTVFAQQHPEVLQLLFHNFDTVDPALLGVVISTIGKIGFSDEGKRVLVAHENQVLAFFQKMGEIIGRKDALCVTAMNTLSILMLTGDEALQPATCRWFSALGPQALSIVVGTAKLPFVETRLSALQLLLALSSQAWGVGLICRASGVLEFLLNRDVEFDKDCKVAKHDVVKALASHPAINSTVPGDVAIKLKQHVNEGPFYVSTELQTAFEQA